nr:unnamed protein product [Callosobruchus analis]
MLISCSNDESLEKVKSTVEAKFRNRYRIATPKPFKPRLLISDVEKSLENKNDFIESLVQNNTFLEDCDLKVISVAKLKYSWNVIIEVDPDVRKHIISRGYLFTTWKKCIVSDHFSVVRCFNCSRFGHLKKDCKNKAICSLCLNEHAEISCNSNIKKFVNCYSCNNYIKNRTRNFKPFPVDHAASDRICPCFLKRVTELKSRIDYG